MSNASRFVVCILNDGYEVFLERHKIYLVLADPLAARHGQARIIVESTEDYPYRAEFFLRIDLPASITSHVAHAA
jgi:hypothetical protein